MARAKTTPELAEGTSATAATSDAVTTNDQAGGSSSIPPDPGLSSGDTQNLSNDETSTDTNELTEGLESGSADQLLSSPDLLIPEVPPPIAEYTSMDGVVTPSSVDTEETDSSDVANTANTAGAVPVNPNSPVVQIYPMRSYMDENELRRRGGPAYSAPRRHAEDLVQRKLASFEPLKE
ncbi:hypothetical protein OH708_03725 [Pseudomonas capsici]|uniref:hypothetical protein n=1 Tax=Pseudomonas capsici TaxID=2810614 RepID=UPI0021F100BB|nr:hypothetical protein [Pseudomonas capsici]MCV4287011.1 hypothetical protein [Pseudomonas capsici]